MAFERARRDPGVVAGGHPTWTGGASDVGVSWGLAWLCLVLRLLRSRALWRGSLALEASAVGVASCGRFLWTGLEGRGVQRAQ